MYLGKPISQKIIFWKNYYILLFSDPFLSGLGRAAEQIQKGVIPNKARAEEIATQQFNLAKKEQNIAEQSRGTSFFRRRKDKSGHHRRSKSLGNFFLKIILLIS